MAVFTSYTIYNFFRSLGASVSIHFEYNKYGSVLGTIVLAPFAIFIVICEVSAQSTTKINNYFIFWTKSTCKI